MILVTEHPIDVAAVRNAVADVRHGAVVVFEGVVRNHDGGKAVTALTYEAHPDAQQFMERTCAELASTHPGASIAAVHRHGPIAIGEAAFVVAVSSPHRELAFTVCSLVVDRVKAELPIWKRQEFADGTHEWVNFA